MPAIMGGALLSAVEGRKSQGLGEIRDLEDHEPTEYKEAWEN